MALSTDDGPRGWQVFEYFFKGCTCIDDNDDSAVVRVVDERAADRFDAKPSAEFVEPLEGATPRKAQQALRREITERETMTSQVESPRPAPIHTREESYSSAEVAETKARTMTSPTLTPHSKQACALESMVANSASLQDMTSRITEDSLVLSPDTSGCSQSWPESSTQSHSAWSAGARSTKASLGSTTKASLGSCDSKGSLQELLSVAKKQSWTQIPEAEFQKAVLQAETQIKPWVEQDYRCQYMLAKAIGNFGYVDLTRRKTDGAVFAAKRMSNIWVCDKPSSFTEKFGESLENPWVDMATLALLQKHSYPYSCRLEGAFRDKGHTYVLTDVATQGDLLRWCSVPDVDDQRESNTLPVATQLFLAVKTLHDMGIAHRDLSLDNVLLTSGSSSSPRLKLADFGMATMTRTGKQDEGGKHLYRAPEINTEPSHDSFVADNFAVGVIIFGMVARTYPWRSTHPRDADPQYQCFKYRGMQCLLEHLTAGDTHVLASKISPQLAEMLGGLLHWDPKERLCMGEAALQNTASSVWEVAWLKEALA
eukprot:TRINITY_DN9356_c0_g1_i1.p1 TRINITY_DN9356_c0_g1~~TRINITY_DN9356_c0_g1_i1.p1  ORF type:complete len:540 (-),score=70.67 TRINITY_DN9356_c0_g1_i1:105-1724(-)